MSKKIIASKEQLFNFLHEQVWAKNLEMAVKFDELRPETKVKYRGKAKLAWDLLIEIAMKKKLDTYESFGKKFDVGKHQVGPYVLHLIKIYCIENKLPYLNSLIVKANGSCGDGWARPKKCNFNEELIKVFNYDWSKIKNPFLFIGDTS